MKVNKIKSFFFVLGLIVNLLKSQNIHTYVGTGLFGATGDGGQAVNAKIQHPEGTCVDSQGNLYIADLTGCVVRKVTPNGIISTYAGTGIPASSGDGGLAINAQLKNPRAVAVDALDNLYIIEIYGNKLRKVDKNTGIINTIAGTGVAGFSGDGGPANLAKLNSPSGVAIDYKGNIFIADRYNNRIRRIDTAMKISTYAGNGLFGNPTDSVLATNTTFRMIVDVAVDWAGNVYIADLYDRKIRKVDNTGIIYTYAGDGFGGNSGDNGPAINAKINGPYDIDVDYLGNLYIADTTVHCVRKVDFITKIITRISGTGQAGYNGDNILAINAALNKPCGVSTDIDANIYISDQVNRRIRVVCSNQCPNGVGINEINLISKISLSPNPSNGKILFQGLNEPTILELYNSMGQLIYNTEIKTSEVLELQTFVSGIYYYKLKNRNDFTISNGKLILQNN